MRFNPQQFDVNTKRLCIVKGKESAYIIGIATIPLFENVISIFNAREITFQGEKSIYDVASEGFTAQGEISSPVPIAIIFQVTEIIVCSDQAFPELNP